MPEFADKMRIPNARVIGQTAKAVLVDADDFDEPIWFPQSQIDDESEVWKEGQEGELIVSDWIALQKGVGR